MGLDSVHRRPSTYGSDAHLFNPHRWDNNWKPDPWSYFPFNRGQRICLGKNLALMQTKYVLCRLVQAYSKIQWVQTIDEKVRVVNGEKRKEGIRTKLAHNTKPAEIVWLRFEK
jgi:cytochrome P450